MNRRKTYKFLAFKSAYAAGISGASEDKISLINSSLTQLNESDNNRQDSPDEGRSSSALSSGELKLRIKKGSNECFSRLPIEQFVGRHSTDKSLKITTSDNEVGQNVIKCSDAADTSSNSGIDNADQSVTRCEAALDHNSNDINSSFLKKVLCPHCKTEILESNYNALLAHMRRHLIYMPFHCSMCEFHGYEAEEVRSHATSQHANLLWRVIQKKKIDLEIKIREMTQKCLSVPPSALEKKKFDAGTSTSKREFVLSQSEFDSSLLDVPLTKKSRSAENAIQTSAGGKIELECMLCGQSVLNNAKDPVCHVDRHVNFKGYCCPACKINFVDLLSLESHLVQSHLLSGLSLATLLNDAKRFRREETVRLVEFFLSASIADQLPCVQRAPSVACAICSKSVRLRADHLLAHCRKEHVHYAPYKCAQCSVTAVDLAASLRHFVAEHSASRENIQGQQSVYSGRSDGGLQFGERIAEYQYDADQESAVCQTLNACFPALWRSESVGQGEKIGFSTTFSIENQSSAILSSQEANEKKSSATVTCALCRVQLPRQRLSMSAHAKLHLAYKPLKCDYCPFRHFAIARFRRHNARVHRGRPVKVTYEPVDDVQRLIDDMRRQCFGEISDVTTTNDSRSDPTTPAALSSTAPTIFDKTIEHSVASTEKKLDTERPLPTLGNRSFDSQQSTSASSMNFSNMLRTIIRGQMIREQPFDSKTPLNNSPGNVDADKKTKRSQCNSKYQEPGRTLGSQRTDSSYPPSIVMHGMQKRLCRLCNTYIANSSSAFENHASRHLNYKPYSCSYCSYKSYIRGKVSRHVQQVHPELPARITHLPMPDMKEKMRRVKLQCFPFLAGCQWQATTLIRDSVMTRTNDNAGQPESLGASLDTSGFSHELNDGGTPFQVFDNELMESMEADVCEDNDDDDDDDNTGVVTVAAACNTESAAAEDVVAECPDDRNDVILGNVKPNSSIACQLCADPVKNTEQATREHAIGHTNKKTFRCPLCAWKGAGESEVKAHGIQAHGFSDFKVICSVEPSLLVKIRSLCFPKFSLDSPVVNNSSKMNENSANQQMNKSLHVPSVKTFNQLDCMTLTAECNNTNYLNRIECRLCKLSIADNPKSVGIHVKNHLNYKPYRCRFCSYMSCEQSKARRHVENVHSTNGDSIIIEEEVDIKDKVSDMKAKCFPHFGAFPAPCPDQSVECKQPVLDVVMCSVCGEGISKEAVLSHCVQHSDAVLKCSYCPRVFTEVDEASMHTEAVHPLLRPSFEKLPTVSSSESRRALADLCFPGTGISSLVTGTSPNWTASGDSDDEQQMISKQQIFLMKLTGNPNFKPKSVKSKPLNQTPISTEGRAPCRLCNQWVSIHNNSLDVHVKNHLGYKPHSCPYCPYKSCIIGKVKRHLDSVHKFETVKVNSFLKTSDLLKTLLFEGRILCFPADDLTPAAPEDLARMNSKMETARKSLKEELNRLATVHPPACGSGVEDGVENESVEDNITDVQNAAGALNAEGQSPSFAAITLHELDFQNRFVALIDGFLSRRTFGAVDDVNCLLQSTREEFFDRCNADGRRLADVVASPENGTGVKCTWCAVFVDPADEALEWHTRMHLDYKPFRCDSCDFRSGLEELAKRHLLTAHALPDAADRVVFNPIANIDRKIAQTRARCFRSLAGRSPRLGGSAGAAESAARSSAAKDGGQKYSSATGQPIGFLSTAGVVARPPSDSEKGEPSSIKADKRPSRRSPALLDEDTSLEDLKRLHDVVSSESVSSISFLVDSSNVEKVALIGQSVESDSTEIQCQICREMVASDHLSKTKHMTKHVGDFEFRCQYCTYASFVQPETMRHSKARHPDQPAKATRFHVSSRSMSAAYERLSEQCFPIGGGVRQPQQTKQQQSVAPSPEKSVKDCGQQNQELITIKKQGNDSADLATGDQCDDSSEIQSRGVDGDWERETDDEEEEIAGCSGEANVDDDGSREGRFKLSEVVASNSRLNDGTRYICQLCKTPVSTHSSSLYIHVKNHMNYKPYICGYCDYRSPVKSKVRRHVATQHKDVRGSPLIEYAFKSDAQREILHWKSKCFPDAAGSMFLTQTELPFSFPKFDMVTASSATGSNCNGAGERISCMFCKALVADNHSSKTVHAKNHLNSKPYRCAYCKYRSCLRGETRRHLVRQHPTLPVRIIFTESEVASKEDVDDMIDRCFVTGECKPGHEDTLSNNSLKRKIANKAADALNRCSNEFISGDEDKLNESVLEKKIIAHDESVDDVPDKYLAADESKIEQEDPLVDDASKGLVADKCKSGQDGTPSSNSPKKKTISCKTVTIASQQVASPEQQQQHKQLSGEKNSPIVKKAEKESKRKLHDDHPPNVCYNLRTTRSATKKLQESENL